MLVASVAYSGMSIFNSVINSTPIGMSTPAAGNFTAVTASSVTAGSVQANGSPTFPLGTQGAYLGWSHNGLGEADFFAQNGTGVGGFAWFNTAAATQLMSLNQAGVLTVATVDANLNGNVTGNLVGNGTGTWNGPVNGNASSATVAASTSGNSATATLAASATQLAATPAQCGAGTFATGITANGTANCTPTKTLFATTSSVCTTPSGSGSCTTTLTWPSPGFSSGVYIAICSGVNASGAGTQGVVVNMSVTSQTQTTVAVTLTNGTANQENTATFGAINCVGNGT